MKKTLLVLVVLVLLFLGRDKIKKNVPAVPTFPTASIPTLSETQKTGVLVRDLQVPWAIAFLPGGDFLFTQRGGEVKIVKKGASEAATITKIDTVKQFGEGGLMGIAVSPKFSQNNYIFVYYTYGTSGDETKNRVVRYKFSDSGLGEEKIIVDAIPGAVFHNGGRIKFGPDGYLYIAAGDSLNPSLSQDTNSLAGKILRVDEDGRAASGNPFGNLVYSYGHRNPQGLAWDGRGQLWATEHGQSAQDEVNKIEPGANYGWPTIRGDEKRDGMEAPVVHSGSVTWAPSGMAISGNNLYFAGLRGQGLYKMSLSSPSSPQKVIDNLGRIREA
ncbi:MAG: PQQ-dependent sugar dehydrogenase, partial [Candidatus Curtissbacteria bacterium]